MQVGIRELARAEAKHETGGRTGPTALEVLANIDAMTLAMEEATEASHFGSSEILSVHRRLLERGALKRIAGAYRTAQNWIGGNDYNPCGASFVPPPPDEVPPLLEDLCVAVADDSLAPLVQAALVHAQFETIHPFDDGNGRTGRALIHVVLRRRGVAPQFTPPISAIFARSRDRYIAGLTAFRGNGVSDWIELFASATIASARLARQYLLEVSRLQDTWRQLLRASGSAPRAGATAWALLDLLPAHPVISGVAATTLLPRSKIRVYEAIDQLVDASVLLPLAAGKRNRSWEASGMLELIERLETQDDHAAE